MTVTLNVQIREERISSVPLVDGLSEEAVASMLYPWCSIAQNERIGVVRLGPNIRLPAIMPASIPEGWQSWQVELAGIPCLEEERVMPPIGVLRLVTPSDPSSHAGEVVGRVLKRSTIAWPNALAVALVGGPVVPIAGLHGQVGGLRRFTVDVGQVRILTRQGQRVRLALVARHSEPAA